MMQQQAALMAATQGTYLNPMAAIAAAQMQQMAAFNGLVAAPMTPSSGGSNFIACAVPCSSFPITALAGNVMPLCSMLQLYWAAKGRVMLCFCMYTGNIGPSAAKGRGCSSFRREMQGEKSET